MFVAEHKDFDPYILTYVSGEDIDGDKLAAITDLKTDRYYVSEDLPDIELDRPLETLSNSRYLEESDIEAKYDSVEEYVEEVRMNSEILPQFIMERLEDNAKESMKFELEKDSKKPVNIKKKMDILAHETNPLND